MCAYVSVCILLPDVVRTKLPNCAVLSFPLSHHTVGPRFPRPSRLSLWIRPGLSCDKRGPLNLGFCPTKPEGRLCQTWQQRSPEHDTSKCDPMTCERYKSKLEWVLADAAHTTAEERLGPMGISKRGHVRRKKHGPTTGSGQTSMSTLESEKPDMSYGQRH